MLLTLPGRLVALALALAVALAAGALPLAGAAADALPARLDPRELWRLSEQLSEPDGYFRSDNLLSNEQYYPEVLDELIARTPAGGVYLGVGPEQNFSYIATVRPRMAFITDVRRGNLHLQLLYKALFELSADRAEFVSRLFTKPRPAHLSTSSSAAEIMDAYWVVDTSAREVFDRNVREVHDHLTQTLDLPLPPGDLDGIANVYWAFYWFGPSITYASSSHTGFGRSRMANYYQLMLATDTYGRVRSFLASEESFRFVQDMQRRNLIVPVVGNFGGPHALRAIGRWVRERNAEISVFYVSNVEQYLRQEGLMDRFCANVASMPLAPGATFVRSLSGGGGFRNLLGDMRAETERCATRTVPTAGPDATVPRP